MSDASEPLRLNERRRMAQLIEDHAETIAEFAGDKEKAVRLTALMLRMGELPPRVAALAEASATTV